MLQIVQPGIIAQNIAGWTKLPGSLPAASLVRLGRPYPGVSLLAMLTISMRTIMRPLSLAPSPLAAPSLKSRIRPLMYGPRSLTFNETCFPLEMSVTLIMDPNGSIRCAHVIARGFNGSPLAVIRPACPRPYQEAVPTWVVAFRGRVDSVRVFSPGLADAGTVHTEASNIARTWSFIIAG